MVSTEGKNGKLVPPTNGVVKSPKNGEVLPIPVRHRKITLNQNRDAASMVDGLYSLKDSSMGSCTAGFQATFGVAMYSCFI